MAGNLSPTLDQKIFSRTAAKVKAVNLYPVAFRGGFRF